MNLSTCLAHHFSSHQLIISQTYDSIKPHVPYCVEILIRSISNGGTVFFAGNGGSAADSQHLAAELVGRFKKDRRALRSIALTTDSSILTCVANDFGYDQIFSRQLEALARPGDVFIGISTSGRSPNILRAFEMAKSLNLSTIGFFGNDGGLAQGLVDCALVVPSSSTARIQEAHILIGHILCELIEQELGLA